MKDKELLAEAEKGRLDFDPLIGSAVQKLVVEFLSMPADTKNRLQTALKNPPKR